MTLYLVGLGVYSDISISESWKEAIRKSEKIFLETYTSPMPYNLNYIKKFFERNDIMEIDRKTLEENIDEILKEASESDIAILVYGDPLIATTHKTLLITGRDKNIEVRVYHNLSSYLYAITESGLDIYKIGPIGTLVRGGVEVNRATLTKIYDNLIRGLHSPILLEYNFEENYIMHPSEALDILKEEKKLWERITANDSYILVLMGLGFQEERKKAFKPDEDKEIRHLQHGYPSIIIITGKLHFMEREYIEKILRRED